jgi:ABC-type transporter Mla maintaining outer membrane lipid asymmetry permease subunit MlaE
MRFRVAGALVALSIMLGGCAGGFERLQTAISIGTATVQNPVTRERLAKVESAAVLVFTGLNAWRDLCEAGQLPQSCVQQIRTAQIYTRQIKPYLRQLRTFVKQNDQVNAGVVFNQVVELIGIVRGQAAAGGHPIAEPGV